MNYGFVSNEVYHFLPVHTGISESTVNKLHRDYKAIITKLKKQLANAKSESRSWKEHSETYEQTLGELVIRHNIYPQEAHRAFVWNKLQKGASTDEIVKPLSEEEYPSPILMDDEAYIDVVDQIVEELEFLRSAYYVMSESHKSWINICEQIIEQKRLKKKDVVAINDRHRSELQPSSFDYREKHKPLDFDYMEPDCQERINELLDLCSEAAGRLEARKIKALSLKKTCRHLAEDYNLVFEAIERRHEDNVRQTLKNGFYHRYSVEEAKRFVDKAFARFDGK